MALEMLNFLLHLSRALPVRGILCYPLFMVMVMYFHVFACDTHKCKHLDSMGIPCELICRIGLYVATELW